MCGVVYFDSLGCCVDSDQEKLQEKDTQCKKVKVKQARYRPGVAQRVPGS